MSMHCIGCESSEKDSNFITQTDYWKIFLNPKQTYLGRSIITLKRHCGELSLLKSEEWEDLYKLIKVVEPVYKKAFGAKLLNWSCLMNNAYQNNPPNPHVHWHLRPRYDKKVKFFGVVFKDLEFGHHYSRGNERSYHASVEIQQEIINKLQETLKEITS